MLSHRRFRSQQGLSLVELLVGITVGMFVVAAAAMLVSNQMSSNRKLLLETQLQQDLRATLDIMTRDLRRAGYDEVLARDWPGQKIEKAQQIANIELSTTAAGNGDITFKYARSPERSGWPLGYQLDEGRGVIKTRMYSVDSGGTASTVMQDLTDARVMKVTQFRIDASASASERLPCPKLCPTTGDDSCWPKLNTRDYRIEVSAESANDNSVKRTMATNVRVRNDYVAFQDATRPTLICPT